MKYQLNNLVGQRLCYIIKKWKTQGDFEIIYDISLNVTLVHLMDSVGSFNHAVSIFGYWIFDTNYNKALPLTQYSLNLICSHLERK